jgi:hypothetical protein
MYKLAESLARSQSAGRLAVVGRVDGDVRAHKRVDDSSRSFSGGLCEHNISRFTAAFTANLVICLFLAFSQIQMPAIQKTWILKDTCNAMK